MKNLKAPYRLSQRTDEWIKIKPDYIDGMSENLDLIVLGGYFGDGSRRAGGVSHFLLGVIDEKASDDPNYPNK